MALVPSQEAGKERKGILGALQENRAACQGLWGRGTAAVLVGAQEDCQEWVEGDGKVVGQEGRPGEAGGTGIQDRGSGDSQEAEQSAPGLEAEEGEGRTEGHQELEDERREERGCRETED